MRQWDWGIGLALLALAGCSSTPAKNSFADLVDDLKPTSSPLSAQNAGSSHSLTSAHQSQARFAGATHTGTGSFVSGAAPGTATARMAPGGQGYEINLVNPPVADVLPNTARDQLAGRTI